MPTYYELEKMLDDALAEIDRLRAENAQLQTEAVDYLSKWVAAQDLAYNRQVLALLEKPHEQKE